MKYFWLACLTPSSLFCMSVEQLHSEIEKFSGSKKRAEINEHALICGFSNSETVNEFAREYGLNHTISSLQALQRLLGYHEEDATNRLSWSRGIGIGSAACALITPLLSFPPEIDATSAATGSVALIAFITYIAVKRDRDFYRNFRAAIEVNLSTLHRRLDTAINGCDQSAIMGIHKA